MKRKLWTLLLCLCLLGSLVLTAGAVSGLPMVVDNAGLFSEQERSGLEEKAQSLRRNYEMDVVILTADSLNGEPAQAYAGDYFDDNGYGYGESHSGLLFLLAMEEREWYISTCGDAIYAFTDYGLDQLGEEILPYLSNGDYYGGFDGYLDALPAYFDAYRQGEPIYGPASPAKGGGVVHYQKKTGPNLFLSLALGLAAATVTVLIMRGSMNTKRRQHSAEDYLKNGSFDLRVQRDVFLYSQVSKVRRQESSSGGGSHVHRSSSGHSHGGRGGKF